MIHRVRITVLMEHRSLRESFATEHGLSLWIEADGIKILFDTGQSGAFAENAKILGIDLTEADFIVLSHGHYDHTGGLEAALAAAPQAQVCFHPEIGIARYSHHLGLPVRAIGMPLPAWNALQSRFAASCLCSAPVRISDGIWLTGPIPKLHPIEHPQSIFSRDEQGVQRDFFNDDQAMLMQTVQGNLIITGCCHSGIANTLVRASQITEDERCVLLVGGLHLLRSDSDQIQEAMKSLHHAGVQELLSGHCTGDPAEAELSNHGIGQNSLKVGSGWEMIFAPGVPPSIHACHKRGDRLLASLAMSPL